MSEASGEATIEVTAVGDATVDIQDVADATVDLADTPESVVEVYGSYVGTGALIPGPAGPAGADGRDGLNGQPRYQGFGPPPDVIVGSNPGDLYFDRSTGDLYQLT